MREAKDAWKTLRLAFRVRRDPAAYYRHTAEGTVRYLRRREVLLEGRRVIDAGAGPGAIADALSRAGAHAVALDLDDGWDPAFPRTPFVVGDAVRLPFADDVFDGAVSSNVLEHVARPMTMVGELVRVVRAGGFVYLSFTNWLSPFGGHEMSPFHYLGPRAGLRAYRAVRRRDPARNVPGRNLFVVHVGPVLRALRSMPVEIVDVAPRYYPSLRFLARVPGLREFAMWNCLVLIRVRPAGARPPA